MDCRQRFQRGSISVAPLNTRSNAKFSFTNGALSDGAAAWTSRQRRNTFQSASGIVANILFTAVKNSGWPTSTDEIAGEFCAAKNAGHGNPGVSS